MKRVMAKAKIYGFSPWVDQVDAINQIMKETGERTESVLLRQLVDEALRARRNKSLSASLTDESDNEFGKRLEAIEALLMRLVRQENALYRVLEVCLVLLQEVLGEAYLTRRLTWESLIMPQLQAKGISADELQHQFQVQMDQAHNDTYALAEQIKDSQESPKRP